MDLGDAVQFLGQVSDEIRDQELDHANAFCMISRLPAGGSPARALGSSTWRPTRTGCPS